MSGDGKNVRIADVFGGLMKDYLSWCDRNGRLVNQPLNVQEWLDERNEPPPRPKLMMPQERAKRSVLAPDTPTEMAISVSVMVDRHSILKAIEALPRHKILGLDDSLVAVDDIRNLFDVERDA